MSQTEQIKQSDGRWVKAQSPSGEMRWYSLSDDSHYLDKPEEGSNYVGGFTPGYYRTIDLSNSRDVGEYPLENVITWNKQLNSAVDESGEVIEHTPDEEEHTPLYNSIFGIASEDNDIQKMHRNYETKDINRLWATRELENNYGGKAWGKQGLWMLGGAGGAYLGAATGAGIGLMNLYGAYTGGKHLFSDDGIKLTSKMIRDRAYIPALFNFGLNLLDGAAVAAPAFGTLDSAYSNPITRSVLQYPGHTIKSIRNHTFRPLMTTADRRAYINNVKNYLESKVRSFSTKIQAQAKDARLPEVMNTDQWEQILQNRNFGNIYLNKNVSSTGERLGWNGLFNPSTENIYLVNRSQNHPFLLTPQDLSEVYAHELGHFWQWQAPSVYRNYTVPGKGYYIVADTPEAQDVFKPLLKYQNGEWVGSPNEVMSEVNRLMQRYQSTDLLNTHPEETINYISSRFGLTKEETAEMLQKMFERGLYKQGGKIRKWNKKK